MSRLLSVLLLLLLCGIPFRAGAQSRPQLEQARHKLVDEILVPGGRHEPARRAGDARHAAARVRRRRACGARPISTWPCRSASSRRSLAAHRRAHDAGPRSAADRQGAGDRHGQRLPGGGAQPAGEGGLHDRDRRAAGQVGRAARSSGWATRTSTSKSATATSAGPSTRRSTRSSSPARRRKCRSRWSTSSPKAGLMIVPVGERYQQTLYLLRKKDGKLESEALLPTLFVPMTGKAEEQRAVKPDPANPQLVNGSFEEDGVQERGAAGLVLRAAGGVEDRRQSRPTASTTSSSRTASRASARTCCKALPSTAAR